MKIRRRLAAILSAVMVLSSLQWSAVPVLASEEVTADETVVAMDEVTAGQEEVTADDEAVSAGFDDEVSVDADSNGVTADDEISADDDIMGTGEAQDNDMAGSLDNADYEDIDVNSVVNNDAASGQGNQSVQQKDQSQQQKGQADPQQKVDVSPAAEEEAPSDKPLSGNIKKNGGTLLNYSEDYGFIYQNDDGTISGNYIDVYWNIDNKGLLTVTGKGEYSKGKNIGPWCNYSHMFNEARISLTGTKCFYGMFYQCWNLKEADLTGLDTSAAEDMSYMFYCCGLKTIDLRGFDTSNVGDMSFMFAACQMTSADLSGLDLSNVGSFNSMFWECKNLATVTFGKGRIGRDNPEYQFMFGGCTCLTEVDISNLNTTNAVYEGMFNNCNASKITFPALSAGEEIRMPADTKWLNNTSGETTEDNLIAGPVAKGTVFTLAGAGGKGKYYGADMEWKLDDNGLLTAKIDGDMSDPYWDPYDVYYSWPWSSYCASVKSADITVTKNTTRLRYMLYHCVNMTSFTFNDASDLSNVTDVGSMLVECASLKSLDLSGLNLGKATNINSVLGWGCTSLESVDLKGINLSSATTLTGMFGGCTSLKSVGFSNAMLGNVTDMSGAFWGCTSLQSIDLSNADLSSVTNMSGMFTSCTSLQSIDLSNAMLGNVTDMSHMFFVCTSLENVDFGNTNLSSVQNMTYMFTGCTSLQSVDLSGHNLSKVTNMTNLFSGCTSLKSVDFGNTDLSSVTDISGMFGGCTNLANINLNGLDLSTLTEMGGMFVDCASIESVDLSGVSMSSVTSMNSMFKGCTSLKSVDLSGLDLSEVEDMSYMFAFCSQLTEIELNTGYSSSTTPVLVGRMFAGCSRLQTIDLTGIRCMNPDYGNVFLGCDSLQYIALNKDLNTVMGVPLYYGDSAMNTYRWVNTVSDNAVDSIDSNGWDPGKLAGHDRVEYYRQAITGLELSPKSFTVQKGGEHTISATANYSVLAGKKALSPVVTSGSLLWTISNKSVITGIRYNEYRLNGNQAISTFTVSAGDKNGSSTITGFAENRRDVKKAAVTATAASSVAPKVLKNPVKINLGESLTIDDTIIDTAGIGASYTLSNTDIATLSGNVLTSLKTGTCTVTAKVGAKNYAVKVNILNPVLTGPDYVLLDNKTATLKVTGGDTVTDWQTSNPKVLSITNRGVIKGLNEGTATVTAINNGKMLTKEIHVYSVPGFKFKSVDLNSDKVLYLDSSLFEYAGRGMDEVTFKVNNPKIAVVENGKLKPVSTGSVTLTATLENKYYTTKVNIYDPTLAAPDIVYLNKTAVLKVTSGAATTYWSSSNPDVLSISNKGVVKGLSKGYVTVTAVNNGRTLTKWIHVCDVPRFKVKAVNINMDKPLALDSNLFEDEGIGGVTFKVSNTNIAKIENNNTLRPVKTGTVILTATADKKNYTTRVNIYDPTLVAPDVVYLNKAVALKVASGVTATKWTSSDTNVLSITDRGIVKGLQKGYVTVTAVNNGRRLVKRILVASVPKFSARVYNINDGDTLDLNAIFDDGGIGNTKFSVNKPSILELNGSTLTGLAKGSCVVTAVCDNKKYTATVNVYTPALTGTDSLLLDNKTATLKVINGLGTTTWTSSDESIVSVKNGVIKGLQKGSSEITAINNGRTMKQEIHVYNVPYFADKKYVTNLDKPIPVTLTKDDDMPAPVYSVNNARIATVDSNSGLVTPVKTGTVTVYATVCGRKYSTTVAIFNPQITGTNTVKAGRTITLGIKGGNGATTWKVDDEEKATITERGVLKGKAAGTVTVTAVNNGRTMTKEVTVVQ